MGVCTGCSAETADDQLKDGHCPNCAGGTTEAPAEAPAAPAEGGDAPAEAPAAPAEGGDAPAA